MTVDLLRDRLDSQDRRAYREWLKHLCDIYPVLSADEQGETQYPADADTPDDPENIAGGAKDPAVHANTHCLVDERHRVMKNSAGELIVVDATVQFAPSADVDQNYILKNLRKRSGMLVTDKILRVEDVINDNHPTRGGHLITALCKLH